VVCQVGRDRRTREQCLRYRELTGYSAAGLLDVDSLDNLLAPNYTLGVNNYCWVYMVQKSVLLTSEAFVVLITEVVPKAKTIG
jgi:hypothetical protein